MKAIASRRIGPLLAAILAGPCCVLGQEVIKLDSPLERQVFQRDASQHASVTVAGTAKPDATVIEAKADLSAEATRGRGVGWTLIAQGAQIKEGKFSGRLTLPTGGWYQLAVRARKGEEVVAEGTIRKVGVGEVFVTAGQSNSTNYGGARQKAQDDRVVYFDAKAFVPAADPIPDSCGGGGTPWPILGDLVARTIQAPVCFRSATVNWLRVREWVPGAKSGNFERLVERVKWFSPGGVRAVLWHQGEADSGRRDYTPTEQYALELAAAIQGLRKEVGYQVDWFLAGASYCPPKSGGPDSNEWQPGIDSTLAAQKSLCDKQIASRGPDTNDLVGRHRSDGVHFSQLGLQTHAERWYAALSAKYNYANPVSSTLK